MDLPNIEIVCDYSSGTLFEQSYHSWDGSGLLLCDFGDGDGIRLLALDRPFRHTSILGLARQIVDVDVTTRGRIALNNAKHPADLKLLASKDGLLNPDPERRTTLSEIVDRFQDILEEDEEGMV